MKLWQALELPPNPRVAVIGGGGKTSILFQLAQEGRELGHGVVVTTTTRMGFPHQHSAWLSPVAWGDKPGGAQVPFIYGRNLLAEDKVAGVSPQQLDELGTLNAHSALLYEADGSRGRPIKIHGPHEPVVAGCTTHTLVIMGMSAWGQPLDAHTAHREELLGDLQGRILDVEVAACLLNKMISHARGIPVVVLNQVSTPELECAAHTLAQLCTQRVVLREHGRAMKT